ncbi:MAG: S9 family peptidase [Chloroflexi bacterium]|nr:S9 family peptidase [Chloroflexota bacterium]
MSPQSAPYGSWKSPITSDLIVSESISITGIAIDGDDVYWIEMRPSDNARNVVVRRTPDGKTEDVTPSPFNVRTTVHEYGGGSLAVSDGVLYFSNFDDQRLYRQQLGDEPTPLTPVADMRYADGVVDKRRNQMYCVREDHTSPWQEAVNTIVSIDLATGSARTLISGSNFYSSPRLSPDGAKLTWLSWNHPNMPWDGTELWVGEIAGGGSLGDRKLVAGGTAESIFQPEWSPGGVLHFVSDRTGWWNIFRETADGAENLCERDAEFGLPGWAFGESTYGFASETRIVCAYNVKGSWTIADLDTGSKTLQDVPTPFTDIGRLGLKVTPDRIVFTAGSPTTPMTLMHHDLRTGETTPLRRSTEVAVDEGYLSVPEAIEYPTENGLTSHAFFYPPKNSDFSGDSDEKPPLLVMSHGGPTDATTSTLSLMTQYWTSRGIGVLDVNYGGSTGYGTEYRRRLNGNWGIVDVDDCVNGARYLVERGDADGDRLIIRGGSAGGFTTLLALTTRDVFKAGASYYGLSELESFVNDTHKFESRYLFTMIGPYPERKDLYYERSAINHVDKLSVPMIMFQGLEDKIVPPSQAEVMLAALRDKGLPVAYVPFEGEQHGFRKAENIKRALDCELYFYSRVFGFALAEAVEPVEIENLR